MATAHRTCSIPDCERPFKARGWCDAHYARWHKHGSPHVNLYAIARICSLPECPRPHYGRGWCANHYALWRKNGSPLISKNPWGRPASERFWTFVNKNGPIPEFRPDLGNCWLWTGGLKGGQEGNGYGNFDDTVAHRFSYELLVGPIPDGLPLDHLCRVRHCVRPFHLEPVTNRENVLRGISPPALAAQRTHCDNGHPFDLLNTYVRAEGGRRCRTCRLQYQRSRRNELRRKGLPVT